MVLARVEMNCGLAGFLSAALFESVHCQNHSFPPVKKYDTAPDIRNHAISRLKVPCHAGGRRWLFISIAAAIHSKQPEIMSLASTAHRHIAETLSCS